MAISDELTKLDAVRDALVSSVNNKGGSLAVDSTLWQIKAGIDAIQQDSGGSSDCDHPDAVQPSPTVAIDKTTGKITTEYTPVAGLVTDTSKKSAELQLTIQAAQTITPGTSNKTIAADRYLTGVQTIAGDANLTAGNIKKGVSIFNVAGEYEGEGSSGGGGGAFDLVKVTEYTPYQAAFSGISAVTFSGFGTDEMTGEDYSVLNGTFTVENETESDPLARTFTNGSYYLYYYPDSDGMNGGSAWCISRDKSYGGYSAWLFYNTEAELASGSITWYNMMGTATSTATVVKTNYPEVQFVLKGQKAEAYDSAEQVWTFAGTVISFSAATGSPKVNALHAASGDVVVGDAIQGVGTIPADGLVFYWRGDKRDTETGQTMVEDSAPVYTTVNGIACAYFDASSYCLYSEDNHPFTTGARTFSGWVFLDGANTASIQPFFAIGSFSKNQAFNLEIPQGKGVRFSSWENYISAAGSFLGWHHVAASYDGTTVSFYVDGVLVGQQSMSLNTSASRYSIGSGVNGESTRQYTSRCYIAACRAYNRALSADEIASLAVEFV